MWHPVTRSLCTPAEPGPTHAGVAEQFAITEATLSAWSSLDDGELLREQPPGDPAAPGYGPGAGWDAVGPGCGMPWGRGGMPWGRGGCQAGERLALAT